MAPPLRAVRDRPPVHWFVFVEAITVIPLETAAQGARRTAPVRRREVRLTGAANLDPMGRRVRRDGVEIHLRPKELALLFALISHQGRALSRSELLDRVWGDGYAGDPRTLDVHIRWLRTKLEPDPPNPAHFRTVRGHGYRFDPPAPPTLIES